MNHHGQQMQETPSTMHQMNYSQHGYMPNPQPNVTVSSAQATQSSFVPPTSMHLMPPGNAGPGNAGASVNVDANSNQQNHQYTRSQNEQSAAPPIGGVNHGAPVSSETGVNSGSNSGQSSSAASTAKTRAKIVIKDPTSNKVVDVGDWRSKSGPNATNSQEGKSGTKVSVSVADSKDTSKQNGSDKKGAFDNEASKRKDSGARKYGDNANGKATDDDKRLTEPVVNGHADIPAATAAASQNTPVESTGSSDLSKVDFGKLKEFVPKTNKVAGGRAGEQPILVAKPSIDSEADVAPSPTVATVTDQSAECAGQEVTVYKFDLKKNSQAVINTDNGKCIIVQASPTSTPAVEDTEKVPVTANNNNNNEVEVTDNLPAASKASSKGGAHKDKHEGSDKTNHNDFPKRGEKFVSSSAAAAATAASNASSQSGNERNKHVKGKDGPADGRKTDFASRAPEDKSMPDNQGGSFKNAKGGKRKKKEKEFEKRGETNLLSAYEQNEPAENKNAATVSNATHKNSSGGPASDAVTNNNNASTGVSAATAPSKPNKLGLGTITAVDNSSTSEALQKDGSPLGAEAKASNAECEKAEEETSWEDKTVADDTPENGNKATKFADGDSSPSASNNAKSSSARKVYDRDFLLSKQKAAGSLKKAPFTEEPHLKDIVTHSPQFLQPLADNVPVNDFRDFSSSHSYGNSSLGGSGNDFAPDFLRRQQRPMGGPTNSRGKSGMGSGNNLQGGGNKSFRSDRGSHNHNQGRMQFTTSAQNQDIRLTESENAWKSKRKQDFSNTDEEELKTENIKRATTAILNKLTPNNFSLLSNEMARLDIDTDERVGFVIDITFEKACMEPNFAEAYANMCKTVLSIRSRLQEQKNVNDPGSSDAKADPVVTLFRRQLLNRCQQEFQREKDYEKEYEAKRREIENTVWEKEKEKREALENLELELKRSKKKSLGNNRFIGELFKLDFLTERIMHSCIESLLKNSKDEDSLECMCKLLTTIGRKMDHETGRNLMDQYFKRIHNMIVNKQTSSRIRFMLQDVVDLRAKKWESNKETAPKTIDQIHKEAREEDIQMKIQAENLKSKSRNDRQNSYNDRKFQHNNRLGGNSGPGSQQEWQPQTVGSNSGRNTDIRSLLDKTKIGALDTKLGSGFGTANLGGNRSTWSKGSVGTSQKNNASGPTSSQGSSGSNRFGALQDAFSIGSDEPQESNRSISSDHRNRGASDMERQRSRDGGESSRHMQSSRSERNHRGGNMSSYASSNGRGDSPADGRGGKFVSSGASRFAGASGSTGSASGRSFSGASGSGKQSTGATYPTQNSAEIPLLSMEALHNKVFAIITEFVEIQDVKECCEIVQTEVAQANHSDFVKCYFEYAVDKKVDVCKEAGRLLYELVKTGIIAVDSVKTGVIKSLVNAVDLCCDVPLIWCNYGLVLGPIMRDQLSLSQLPEMAESIVEEDKAREFVAEVVLSYSRLTSKEKVAKAWAVAKVNWRQFTPSFVSDEQLQEFLKDKDLTFTLSANNSEAGDDLVSYEAPLLELVKKNPYESTQVFEFIQKHLTPWLNKPECIELLTRVVCKACFKRDVTPVSFDNNLFEPRKVVLLRYINHDKDLMFHAIYSIQLLASDYKYPAGLLDSIFRCLYDADVITSEAFLNWRDNKDPKYNRGKGSCTVQLKQFMTYVAEGDESESD